MDTKRLVKENNEKRKQLSKDHLNYYEDMLVYIRLASHKSEQETEEILTELLDHLLEAQDEGKTAEQVFGENPKQLVDEIIGELSPLVTKKRTVTFAMFIIYFLAFSGFFIGLFDLFGYYVFQVGALTRDIYLGSFVVEGLISIVIAFVLLYGLISYFRWLCFRKINKIIVFLSFGLYGLLAMGLYASVLWFVPDFGSPIILPLYWNLIIGILLYFVGRLVNKTI